MSETDSRLANRILIGLVLGAVAGGIVAAIGTEAPRLLSGAQWLATYILEPLGQVFLRMLFFVVIPLVFASLANGILQLHELSDLGPLAGAHVRAVLPEHGDRRHPRSRHDEYAAARAARLDEATSARLIEQYSGQAAGHVEKSASARR